MRGKLAMGVGSALLSAAVFAPGAFASGGLDSGGSGGGGGGGGGGTTTTTLAAPTSCASITGFSNTTGYYSVWAAIWTSFSFKSTCSTQVTMNMTYFNNSTATGDFARSTTVSNGTIDEDWAAFSTPYTVTMTLTDTSGSVLATTSALVTTKVPKSGA